MLSYRVPYSCAVVVQLCKVARIGTCDNKLGAHLATHQGDGGESCGREDPEGVANSSGGGEAHAVDQSIGCVTSSSGMPSSSISIQAALP